MPWTWVRPADPMLLEARPLLDVGTGDGQTLAALGGDAGLVVGADHSMDAIRVARRSGVRRVVCAEAAYLPYRSGSVGVVLAGDLFHHLGDEGLRTVAAEARRVLRREGTLVAWWYERAARPGPGAPAHPRTAAAVAKLLRDAGFVATEDLELEFGVDPTPPTVGLVAYGN